LGLLLGRARVLDLGCGQGLLAAWLQAAERCYDRGSWPRAWPPAPRALSTRGIELMARDVERARCALGVRIRSYRRPTSAIPRSETVDAVVILDVFALYDSAGAARSTAARPSRAGRPGACCYCASVTPAAACGFVMVNGATSW